MTVVAIDPGSKLSAWVTWDGRSVWTHGKEANEDVLTRIYQGHWLRHEDRDVYTHSVDYVFEQVASYGMAVGADVFETVFWTGRFYQQAIEMAPRGQLLERMPRRAVKLHLCGQSKAKDTNIRQALIDRFGGKGTKAAPGVFYGFKADEWQAMALAVTWFDQQQIKAVAV